MSFNSDVFSSFKCESGYGVYDIGLDATPCLRVRELNNTTLFMGITQILKYLLYIEYLCHNNQISSGNTVPYTFSGLS